MALRQLHLRERLKRHLHSLLKIKKKNPDREVVGLQDEINDVVVVMGQGDVALVEKIVGVKALS